jgi:hypothetical protein
MLRLQPPDHRHLAQQLRQRRDVEITFQQGREHAEMRIGGIQQLPDRVADRRGMRVHAQVLGLDVMPGDMRIDDALARQRLEEGQRVVAVVDAVDVDVVDVQQQAAVGALQHRQQEFEFAHPCARRGVVRDVLHRDRPLQDVLHAADARGDIFDRLGGEGNRHQVVQMAVVGTVGEMLGVITDAMGIEKALHVAHEILVQRRRAAERQRQAVADERVAFGQRAELAPARAADVHPVLRGDFQEGSRFWKVVRQRAQEGPPQTEAGATNGRFERVHGAGRINPYCAVPPSAGFSSAFLSAPHLPSPHLPSPHLPSAGLAAAPASVAGADSPAGAGSAGAALSPVSASSR